MVFAAKCHVISALLKMKSATKWNREQVLNMKSKFTQHNQTWVRDWDSDVLALGGSEPVSTSESGFWALREREVAIVGLHKLSPVFWVHGIGRHAAALSVPSLPLYPSISLFLTFSPSSTAAAGEAINHTEEERT